MTAGAPCRREAWTFGGTPTIRKAGPRLPWAGPAGAVIGASVAKREDAGRIDRLELPETDADSPEEGRGAAVRGWPRLAVLSACRREA